MRNQTAVVVLILAAVCHVATALAQPEARVVARIKGQKSFRASPVQARVGQTVELAVQVRKGGNKSRYLPLPSGAKVSWERIEPKMRHVALPPPNKGIPIYSNSVLYGASHGRWLGYDTIEYDTIPLSGGAGVSVGKNTLSLTSARGTSFGGAGTTWVAATITVAGGTKVSTPNMQSTDHVGLSPQVMRVSFRSDDGYLGWLTTYFGIPYVFGSTGLQTDRYVGADCADVLVGARRASGKRATKYVSVRSINHVARPLTPVLWMAKDGAIRDGQGVTQKLQWGKTFSAGDLLVMDFVEDPHKRLKGSWDHIGALTADSAAGQKGLLDGTDGLRHMAYRGLVDEPLVAMGNIRLRLWRWTR